MWLQEKSCCFVSGSSSERQDPTAWRMSDQPRHLFDINNLLTVRDHPGVNLVLTMGWQISRNISCDDWRTPRFKIFSDILTVCWSSSLTPPLPVERCQLMMSRNDDKSELMTVQLTSSLGTFSDGRLAILTWGRHYQLYLATFSLNHQWTRRVKQVSKVDWIQLWIL